MQFTVTFLPEEVLGVTDTEGTALGLRTALGVAGEVG
jgi:hypothetical protein